MVVLKQTLTLSIKFQTIPTPTIQIFKETEDLDLSFHPVRPVVELATPQRNVIMEQTKQTDHLSERDDWQTQVQQRNAQSNPDGNVKAAAQTLN